VTTDDDKLEPIEGEQRTRGMGSTLDKLNELGTSSVEPMAQVLYDSEETATLRADVERKTLSNAEALANAVVSGQGYFKVPRVIEK